VTRQASGSGTSCPFSEGQTSSSMCSSTQPCGVPCVGSWSAPVSAACPTTCDDRHLDAHFVDYGLFGSGVATPKTRHNTTYWHITTSATNGGGCPAPEGAVGGSSTICPQLSYCP
jgi:hypothetical protein